MQNNFVYMRVRGGDERKVEIHVQLLDLEFPIYNRHSYRLTSSVRIVLIMLNKASRHDTLQAFYRSVRSKGQTHMFLIS